MSAPKVYRSDPTNTAFTKAMLGQGRTWSIADMEGKGQFTFSVQDHGVSNFQGWICTREELADLWEMIGEALHHD